MSRYQSASFTSLAVQQLSFVLFVSPCFVILNEGGLVCILHDSALDFLTSFTPLADRTEILLSDSVLSFCQCLRHLMHIVNT